MKCFQFSNGEKKGSPSSRKPTSGQSNSKSISTTSTECDTRKSGSDSNSQNVSDTSSSSIGRSTFLSFSQRPNNLRTFAFAELKSATRNFSRALMIGEGGFGCVYRGVIRSSEDPSVKLEVAVKQLNRKGLQGHKEWLTEVNVLGVVEHLNLVKLVGYCADSDERGLQRLLVYEYMPNRSVEDHLSNRMNAPLSWDMRLKVALDAARGLTYLHEGMEFQIIFRDMKTSNILLDENWNAKLSDFGLAHEGPAEGLSHVSTLVVGTAGYAAPEYMLTGRLTYKSDIWSYGVVLYELITGRRPMDRNRPKSEQKLLDWVKPYITDAKKFEMIIDPRIAGNCSVRPVMKLALVANKCLARHAKSRPKMSEVLEMVQRIVENAGTGSPQIPLRMDKSDELTAKEAKKKTSSATGEGKWLAWRRWPVKLIKAQ